MTGNGDERQIAAWGRVEAKLDRFGERFDRFEERFDRLEEKAVRRDEKVAHLDRKLERTDERLTRVEVAIEIVRHEVDQKLDRLKRELVDELGRQTRVGLLAARALDDGRPAAVERRVDALEARP